jgi:hypothetical protein
MERVKQVFAKFHSTENCASPEQARLLSKRLAKLTEFCGRLNSAKKKQKRRIKI